MTENHRMIRELFLPVAIALFTGCSRTSTPRVDADAARMAAIRRSADDYAIKQAEALHRQVWREGFIEYYKGDGLGSNYTLYLMERGHYMLTSRGCEGCYGVAVGRWKIEGGQLLLAPEEQQGAGVGLRKLNLMSADPANAIYVTDADLERFGREGPRRDNCFRRSDRIEQVPGE
jgi:hypothetical protein